MMMVHKKNESPKGTVVVFTTNIINLEKNTFIMIKEWQQYNENL